MANQLQAEAVEDEESEAKNGLRRGSEWKGWANFASLQRKLLPISTLCEDTGVAACGGGVAHFFTEESGSSWVYPSTLSLSSAALLCFRTIRPEVAWEGSSDAAAV
eukprot:CAMPEP_0184655982 /NCGR_PEP_ID=MMETSP0308-20130426/15144_1 /TAXON_ID=38269 /ORGANISM="Gloeochaete witrockiana, Strain SAG 46.84" /LENGTH=105 /DNA_ID=CAMNT_0027092835 /DNA_START=865 /DNA_END=1182 /DNA_ORIENTATION=+